jgi:hypothetical protein
VSVVLVVVRDCAITPSYVCVCCRRWCRVTLLRDSVTAEVTAAVKRGLYSQHRLLYLTITAVQVGVSTGDWITADEFDAFLRLQRE